MNRAWQTARALVPLLVAFGLLAGVHLLPPDTSLAQVREAGVLRACVPEAYPPLVTGDPDAPGIDVELLRALAAEIGVRLALSPIPSMGRDFNPRSWGITRAQCDVLAGGVVASPMTRSFLETTPAHAETGWALLASAAPGRALERRRIGVLAGSAGLDRIALSRALRDRQAEVGLVRTPDELVEGLAEGRFEVGVTEALLARRLAAEQGWTVEWFPGGLERYPVVLGLWKGDLTLKRAMVRGLERLERAGVLSEILGRYLSPGDPPAGSG